MEWYYRRESTIVNGVEALCKPFDHADTPWRGDQKLVKARLERVLDTLQILQPLRPGDHASLRKTMEKARAVLMACLDGEGNDDLRGRIRSLGPM